MNSAPSNGIRLSYWVQSAGLIVVGLVLGMAVVLLTGLGDQQDLSRHCSPGDERTTPPGGPPGDHRPPPGMHGE
jgi:hypothetical protein